MGQRRFLRIYRTETIEVMDADLGGETPWMLIPIDYSLTVDGNDGPLTAPFTIRLHSLCVQADDAEGATSVTFSITEDLAGTIPIYNTAEGCTQTLGDAPSGTGVSAIFGLSNTAIASFDGLYIWLQVDAGDLANARVTLVWED